MRVRNFKKTEKGTKFYFLCAVFDIEWTTIYK